MASQLAIEITVPVATALARVHRRGRPDDHCDVAQRRVASYPTGTVAMLDYLDGYGP